MFSTDFALAPQLKADTFFVKSLAFCDCLLMNDKRWPWLILVPRENGLEELSDLSDAGRNSVVSEIGLTSTMLKEFSRCEKINVAAIGNVVRQLHIHVIARNTNDPNWPGPVWGYGQAEKYSGSEGAELVSQLEDKLRAALLS